MKGIKIGKAKLFLGHLPGRKSLCFYFMENNVYHPVAYVSQKNQETAKYYWQILLDGMPDSDES